MHPARSMQRSCPLLRTCQLTVALPKIGVELRNTVHSNPLLETQQWQQEQPRARARINSVVSANGDVQVVRTIACEGERRAGRPLLKLWPQGWMVKTLSK
jgi:hypothetical protein